MKKLRLALALAIVAIFVVVTPVLAAYYAYIYVEESDGNTYESLPASVPCNTTILIQGDFMTSTALDTRVLTGSGETLPHMVADDKVMFITDLAAYEQKTLIFYLGATSLSSFPIIVGYNGSFETPDDPDLELGYVMELLISGYFNADTADIGHNILYKEDAFRVWISAEHTLRVAALNSTGDEQWEMHYSNFMTGEHTVYILANGLSAYLYVDVFDVAKDSANLFETNTVQCIGGSIVTYSHCFYDEGLYWVFYKYDADDFGYITSADGNSWSNATTFRDYGNETIEYWDAKMRDGYIYFSYDGAYGDGTDNVCFRKGDLETNSTVTWSAAWQIVATETAVSGHSFNENWIAVDSSEHPYILYGTTRGSGTEFGSIAKSSATDGAWVAAGGYPFDIYSYGSANGVLNGLIMFPDSDELFALWQYYSGGLWYNTRGDYYNGAAWGGVIEISNLGSYITQIYGLETSMAADANGNLYFTWQGPSASYNGYLTIRHAAGTWEGPYLIAASSSPDLSYNEDNDCLYIIYPSGAYIYGFSLDTIEMEFNDAVAMCARQATSNIYGTNPYENNIGFLMLNTNTFHTYVDLTAYQWNDNGNDWLWNQDNACPYIDDIQVAIDGTLQLEYKPASIIQGTTLPDEENNHDATINWGVNPVGVNTSMSALQFEQSYNETYYYQYLSPGSTDIIKPEPGEMAGDVGIVALRDNPLYPLVQVLTIAGFLTERLAWLGLAWFCVFAAMFLVHLGPDTHKDSEKPQHFILTTITGLGLSILFYTMGIFPLWVIILMAFGLVGAVIWERQPVL